MLILARKIDERIVISLPDHGDVVITVVEIGRGRVRLGFAAPDDIIINRSEVQRAIGQKRLKRRKEG